MPKRPDDDTRVESERGNGIYVSFKADAEAFGADWEVASDELLQSIRALDDTDDRTGE